MTLCRSSYCRSNISSKGINSSYSSVFHEKYVSVVVVLKKSMPIKETYECQLCIKLLLNIDFVNFTLVRDGSGCQTCLMPEN